MVDVVDKATRSRMMSGIRGRNTKPEMQVRRYLHAKGLRYTLASALPGKPDLVFPRFRSVLFVHGCFWHRHSGCRLATTPADNAEFWMRKFAANVDRDVRVADILARSGWRVLTIWACELTPRRLAQLARQIRAGDRERNK